MPPSIFLRGLWAPKCADLVALWAIRPSAAASDNSHPHPSFSPLYIAPAGGVWPLHLQPAPPFLFLGPPSPVLPFYYSIPRHARQSVIHLLRTITFCDLATLSSRIPLPSFKHLCRPLPCPDTQTCEPELESRCLRPRRNRVLIGRLYRYPDESKELG